MLIGELEYDDMVENNDHIVKGNLKFESHNEKWGSTDLGDYIGKFQNVNITQESIELPFPFTDHLFIGIFVFFMTIIMINLLFGLAVSDVQVFMN